MPSLTDAEKPGPRCLARVAENFRMGGSCVHVEWEEFTSHEDETKATRMGINKRDLGFRIVATESGGL
eukprot:12863349-Heterocapsa_arctica.AAC.1